MLRRVIEGADRAPREDTAEPDFGALAVGLGGVRLAATADPRGARGRKWKSTTLLRTMMVGLLSGMRSLKEAERLTNDLGCAMRRKLCIARRVPDTTMREFAMALPFDSALSLLHGQVRTSRRKKQLEPRGLPCGVLAVDGKCSTTDLDEGVYAQHQADGRYSVRTMTCSLVSAAAATVVHLTPDQWLTFIRPHWRVENDVHKTLDVVLAEDEHPWIRPPAECSSFRFSAASPATRSTCSASSR
ncbi:MAG: hypothetical protein EXR76_14220 [Myxococcales bacterium]|nr:hypothetical protein [Myxococcales bacterium]